MRRRGRTTTAPIPEWVYQAETDEERAAARAWGARNGYTPLHLLLARLPEGCRLCGDEHRVAS